MNSNPELSREVRYVSTLDGLTVEEEVIRRKVVRTADLLEAATLKDGISTPVLPQGTIRYESDGAKSVVAIQVRPSITTIQVGTEEYTGVLPSRVYIIRFNHNQYRSTHIYMAKSAITDVSDTLSYSFLPNQYPDGLSCDGSVTQEVHVLPSVAAKANYVVDNMESGIYNNDLIGYKENWPSDITLSEGRSLTGYFAAWQTWSKGDSGVPSLDRLSQLNLSAPSNGELTLARVMNNAL